MAMKKYIPSYVRSPNPRLVHIKSNALFTYCCVEIDDETWETLNHKEKVTCKRCLRAIPAPAETEVSYSEISDEILEDMLRVLGKSYDEKVMDAMGLDPDLRALVRKILYRENVIEDQKLN